MDIAERKCFLHGAADANLLMFPNEAFIDELSSLTILSLDISAKLVFLMLGILIPPINWNNFRLKTSTLIYR